MTLHINPSRRQFLGGSAALGLALVVGIRADGSAIAATDADLVPNPFVKIAADNTVTVIARNFEMGQGTTTGFATLVAEELDADWDQVVTEQAPADVTKYKNPAFGMQGTGGSTAMASSYLDYRKAGAAARDLLVRAAASDWGVPASEITVAKGVVAHSSSGKSAPFGALVARAASLDAAEDLPLKQPEAFTLIGQTIPRKDSAAKTDGTATFALDVKIDGMVYAVIARPQRFGATVASVDDSAARAVNGVIDVKTAASGVVVYAKSTWAAIKGRNALSIEWDDSKAETRGTDEMYAEYEAMLDEQGLTARTEGDAADAFAKSAKTVSADFRFPYLAHAPMEPLNCVLKYDENGAEIWAGAQFQTVEQNVVAHVLGLKPEQVQIHTQYAGGSFGRRATPTADYMAEAAMAAKAIGTATPVKLVWTREDDIKGGYYRPLYVHRIEAGLDEEGKPVAWRHRIVGQSIMSGTIMEKFMVKDGIDGTSVEGASNLPYAIPNLAVELKTAASPVPVLWWRSVGSTHTAFSTEIMIDRLAREAGRDPVDFRLELLAHHPRHANVLKLAAEKADWSKPLPEGWGRASLCTRASTAMWPRLSRCPATPTARSGSNAWSPRWIAASPSIRTLSAPRWKAA
ncbi:molybdopterin cofactor-binding domain-containing protein [Breoghania sp. L-A4]|uniref:xanthine dehydrogenase family protein molybdopterin-binding subunit n=1 Tax=Breoghania sp. L-A4 TaxID=2304600 RepID=UPI0020C0B226|nr:molybdopterin cofactor-binding domain-containing protein [Breoghania sp. L-A4]